MVVVIILKLVHDLAYRYYGKWFQLSIERFDAIHYTGMLFSIKNRNTLKLELRLLLFILAFGFFCSSQVTFRHSMDYTVSPKIRIIQDQL